MNSFKGVHCMAQSVLCCLGVLKYIENKERLRLQSLLDEKETFWNTLRVDSFFRNQQDMCIV